MHFVQVCFNKRSTTSAFLIVLTLPECRRSSAPPLRCSAAPPLRAAATRGGPRVNATYTSLIFGWDYFVFRCQLRRSNACNYCNSRSYDTRRRPYLSHARIQIDALKMRARDYNLNSFFKWSYIENLSNRETIKMVCLYIMTSVILSQNMLKQINANKPSNIR